MRSPMIRTMLGGTLAVAATALLCGGSQWPVGRAPEGSVLRLSWRLPGQRIKLCHVPTAKEVEGLPLHMRRAEYCEERYLRYALAVSADGRPLVHKVVKPPGVHSDRPLYVQEEMPFAAGTHSIDVRFEPIAPDPQELPPDLRGGEVASQLSQAVALSFAGRIGFERGQVRLRAG